MFEWNIGNTNGRRHLIFAIKEAISGATYAHQWYNTFPFTKNLGPFNLHSMNGQEQCQIIYSVLYDGY